MKKDLGSILPDTTVYLSENLIPKELLDLINKVDSGTNETKEIKTDKG